MGEVVPCISSPLGSLLAICGGGSTRRTICSWNGPALPVPEAHHYGPRLMHSRARSRPNRQSLLGPFIIPSGWQGVPGSHVLGSIKAAIGFQGPTRPAFSSPLLTRQLAALTWTAESRVYIATMHCKPSNDRHFFRKMHVICASLHVFTLVAIQRTGML